MLDSLVCIFQFKKKPTGSRLRVSYEFDEDEESQNVLDIDALQSLWEDFNTLMRSLRALPGTEHYMDSAAFQNAARQWAKNFRLYTFDEDVIPYIHCRWKKRGPNLIYTKY